MRSDPIRSDRYDPIRSFKMCKLKADGTDESERSKSERNAIDVRYPNEKSGKLYESGSVYVTLLTIHLTAGEGQAHITSRFCVECGVGSKL